MNWIKKYWIGFIVVFIICSFIKIELSLILLGSLMLYVSIKGFIFLRRLKHIGEETMGTILSYKRGKFGTQVFLIEYKVAGQVFQGEPTIHASSDLSYFESHKKYIDNEILITYDPTSPENF